MVASVPDAALILYETLRDLREAVRAEGAERLLSWRPVIEQPRYLPSAQNLASYLALRRRDLRELQEGLMALGLSSLGRCESRVLPNLDAVLHTLGGALGLEVPDGVEAPSRQRFFSGTRLLQENTAALFGPLPDGRAVHVMVTLSGDLKDEPSTLRALVSSGMRVARINCAKDDPDTWLALAAETRRAGEALGRPVRVAFDLCGPRARTGDVWAAEARRARVGDRILMVASEPQPVAGFDFTVSMSLPEIFPQLSLGAVVTIDEGSLRAVVRGHRDTAVVLEVVATEPRGMRLKRNKGLNFPGTHLRLDPLTPKDREDLDVVAHAADLVGYSFVQSAEDLRRLRTEIEARRKRGPTGPSRGPLEAAAAELPLTTGGPHTSPVGIIAKIETALAVQNLPDIIVTGAGSGPFGVMIARGDLAVEIGYLRLAEIQEELLWLCEAAHVPVIWATEVMSNFVRTGRPTRAEMTDAAMAERAECVMLNKGPFLPEATRELVALLGKMEGHQKKKVSRLRALKSW